MKCPVLALLCSLAVARASAQTSFSQSDWPDLGDLTVMQMGGGGTSGNLAAMPSGGNPGSYVRINLNFPIGFTQDAVAGIRNSWTYRPSVSGAIASVDLAADAEAFGGFIGARFSVAVVQNGNLFFATCPPAFPTTWTHVSQSNDASGFLIVKADGTFGTGNPDFSATGGDLTFGYGYRAGLQTAAAYTIYQNLDNVGIVLHQAVPEPSSCLALLSLSLLMLFRKSGR